MNILNIIANPKPTEEANSKQLSQVFFKNLKANASGMEIINLDLYKDPPPFYGYDVYRYFWYPVFDKNYKPSEKEKKSAEYALRQIKLFNEADVLVITAPMWNFSVPGILKAWIDQVVSPGATFDISEQGVKPLHHIKKIILLTSSGGTYADGDAKEHLLSELKAAFGFVKIDKVEVAWADGQNIFFYKDHEERKEKAKEKAIELSDYFYNT